MIRRGWRVTDDGRLTRGEGRERIERPANGFIGPWRAPWDPQYNPRVDAPAAIRGATFVSPNHYRLGLHTLDEQGRMRDENECPVCGSLPGIGLEIIHFESSNPFAPRWVKGGWTWCPRCIRVEGSMVTRLRTQ